MVLRYSSSKRLLLTVASPIEIKAVFNGLDVPDQDVPPLWEIFDLDERISVLHTGVGKTCAAAAVSKELFGSETYCAVLSIGVAGSYDPAIGLRATVLGLNHFLLDEGSVLAREPGFISMEDAGWTKTSTVWRDSELHQHCRMIVDHEGDVATISTISGTDELRDEYVRRANVKIETMESGAIAQVCAMRNVDYADLRVVSNFCGERKADNHDFPGAMKQVSHLVRAFVALLF